MAEIAGLRRLERHLKTLPGRLAAGAAREAVRAGAEVVLDSVKAHAPVGSGEYRDNVKLAGPVVRGLYAAAEVAVAAADFAHPGEPAAVEFGTHDRPADAPMRRAMDADGARAAAEAVKAFGLALKREVG